MRFGRSEPQNAWASLRARGTRELIPTMGTNSKGRATGARDEAVQRLRICSFTDALIFNRLRLAEKLGFNRSRCEVETGRAKAAFASNAKLSLAMSRHGAGPVRARRLEARRQNRAAGGGVGFWLSSGRGARA
jgi:hypothetical protein